MSRTLINLLVDTILLTASVALAWVAVVLRFVFPRPTAAAGWTLWGYGYDDWANAQFGLVAFISFVILLHVALHWSWVCGVVVTRVLGRKKSGTPNDGEQTIYGVGLLIVIFNIIGLLVAAASLTIQAPPS